MKLTPHPDFWAFMIEAEVIDAERAEEIRARQEEAWIPLGRILIEERFVRMDQMTRLLELQSESTHTRIGALAVREGCCTREQVEYALREQRRRSPHPIELLMADDGVDQAELNQAFISYVRQLEAKAYGFSTEPLASLS